MKFVPFFEFYINNSKKMINKFQIFIILFVNSVYLVSPVAPDTFKSIEHMVVSYGYPFEKHLIETEDGYFIEIHRIPGGKGEKSNQTLNNKPPIYLFHALTQSSIDWIAVGINISLATYFADEGFDVWLGNSRGTFFGRKHKIYLDSSSEFWNYSWHEIGFYDIPATIDFILEKTGKSQVYFTCFSQSCTALLVMGSLRTEYNKKIRLAANMGIVSYVGHWPGLGGYVFPILARILVPLFETFGHFGLTTTPLLAFIATRLTSIDLLLTVITNMIYLFLGPGNTDDERVAFVNDIGFIPGGCSTKQILHYALGVLNPNTFRPYDYGPEKNMIIYNSSSPPEYPVEKVTVPMIIFQGVNDYMVNPVDLEILLQKLPNIIRRYQSPVNHFEYIYHRNARTFFHDKIVELFKMSEESL